MIKRPGAVRLGLVCGALTCGLWAAACRAPKGAEEARPDDGKEKSASPASSARWVFHPKGPQPISARTPIEGGELVIDRGGSRWLLQEGRPPVPAAYGAPEALVAAQRTKGGYAFVGDSGSVYQASEPLGPFTSATHPPEISFGATAHEEVVLAVGQDGRLRRSADFGKSWREVPVDGFVSHVALDQAGRGLLLTVPERWFSSSDRGASFQPISLGTVAPRELLGGGPQVQVVGWLGSFTFDGTALVPAASAGRAAATWTLPRGPSALDVRMGRAALGRDFVALLPEPVAVPGARTAGFHLLQGKLGGALRAREAKGLVDCARYRIAVWETEAIVLCAGNALAGTSVELSLYRGTLEAADFQRQSAFLRGDFDLSHLALGPDGTIALSGICPPKDSDPGCMPRGVLLLGRGQKELETLPLAMDEAPLALGFSVGGRLLGTALREKDAHALVFSAALGSAGSESAGSDGAGSGSKAKPVRVVDLSVELELAEQATGVELLAGGGRLVGVIVRNGESETSATLDEMAEVLTFGSVPADAVAVHGAGLHLAAVSSAQNLLYESADGGVTWGETGLPRPLCAGGRDDCVPLLVCSEVGCLLGDELSRVGWGGEAPSERSLASAKARAPAEQASSIEYVCQLDGPRPIELPSLFEVPGASEAALGDADFSVIEVDPASGAMNFAWVKRGERRLERAPGFAAVSEPDRYALSIIPQIEGAAALRYKIPQRQTGDRMLSEIEVAWNNRIVGLVGHQRFPSLVEGRPGDFHPSVSGPGDAFPELLSVAGRGLYLALHRAGSGDQAFYYFEDTSFETLPPVRLPGSLGGIDDAEYVRVGLTHGILAFDADRSRMYFKGAVGLDGVALLLGDTPASVDRAQGLRLAYRGERMGLVSMMADLDGRYWAARFVEIGGQGDHVLGEMVRVPLKADLGFPPRACSDAERRDTPRIVAPGFPGPSPVLRVQRGSSDIGRFTLGAAVLHGTPEKPCLAAWSGDVDPHVAQAAVSVLLIPSDKGLFGWFFSPRAERQLEGVEAWPIACAPAG